MAGGSLNVPLVPADIREVASSRRPWSQPFVREVSELLGHPVNGWVIRQECPEPAERDLHQTFEISMLLHGQQERTSRDFAVRLGPGELCLIPGWESHGWHTTAPDTYVFVLHFLPEFLGEEALEGRSWLNLFVAPAADRPRVVDSEVRAQVLSIAHELSRETAAKRPGWLTAVRLALLRLLFLISRDWQPATGRSGRGVQMWDWARISPAITRVHSQPGRRVGLAEAAAACSLSVSQFSLLFRRAMGISFGQFASRSRVVHAAQLLTSTDLTLRAIADELGFADASHFHRTFVQHYGCTPASYRGRGNPSAGAER